jgi:translation elongation factor Ts
MAVTIADIQHLRKMTGAGMMDCKKALIEADNDFDKAMEIIRKKGQAVAAKRSDRDASEGCVIAKSTGKYAAMIALKCETDFVAKNVDFVKLTNDILDAAMAAKAADLEAVLALSFGNGTVANAVTDRSGITGEKMELDGYYFVEGGTASAYIHPGNKLATLVALNQEDKEFQGHELGMQIAAMNPVSISPENIPANVLAREKEVAADKAREEGKPENLIENIVNGRMNKFYKEACLLNQEFVMNDAKQSVAKYLDDESKGLTVTAFQRFSLNAE